MLRLAAKKATLGGRLKYLVNSGLPDYFDEFAPACVRNIGCLWAFLSRDKKANGESSKLSATATNQYATWTLTTGHGVACQQI